MSDVKDDLYYTKEDEWIAVDGNTATIGITDYAQDSLSDIVYLELPDEGDSFDAEDTFGVVESVKAAADLYMPLDGTVVAVNEDLVDAPEQINEDPYGAWMVKVEFEELPDDLMDADGYRTYLEERD